MKKFKYETPNLRIKGFNLEPAKGKALDHLGATLGIKRKWFGLEWDSHYRNRLHANWINLMRKKSWID